MKSKQPLPTAKTAPAGWKLQSWWNTKADNEARERHFPAVHHNKPTLIYLKFGCTSET